MDTVNPDPTIGEKNEAAKPIDPVCGAPVDPKRTGFAALHEGEYYQFCSSSCLRKFTDDPAAHL